MPIGNPALKSSPICVVSPLAWVTNGKTTPKVEHGACDPGGERGAEVAAAAAVYIIGRGCPRSASRNRARLGLEAGAVHRHVHTVDQCLPAWIGMKAVERWIRLDEGAPVAAFVNRLGQQHQDIRQVEPVVAGPEGASRAKRARRSGSAVKCAGRILIATSHPSLPSRAR